MFACMLCEGADYDIDNGLYFCKTCGTLSRDHHVQEMQDLEYVQSGRFLKEIKVGKRITMGRNLGRPWTIYEGYQCILLAQCDALIALGAKQELKEILFTIWANYLSKLEVAFCETEKIVPDIVLKGFGRRRELYRGTFEKPWNRVKKYKKRSKQATTPSGKKRRRIDDDALDYVDSDEEDGSYNESQMGGDDTSDSSSEDDEAEIFVEECDKRSKRIKIKSYPEWMDLKKTVVLLHIALRFSNPEILLVDLLRWIYDGRVPYMSTSHLLKDDMILSKEDPFLFMPKNLSVQSVLSDTERMTCFLDLPVKYFPVVHIGVGVFIKEFVDRLHLPDELFTVSKRIYKEHHPRMINYEHVPRCELAAVCYIAVALHLIFGLDDNTEYQLSKYSEEVQKAIGSETKNVFVWRQWRSYQSKNDKNDFNMYRDWAKNRKFKYQNLNEILESCHRFRREDRRISVSTTHLNDVHHASKMTGLCNPIKSAVAACKPSTSCAITDTDRVLLVQKFRGSTLSHLIEFDEFKAKFKNTMDDHSWETLAQRRKEILASIVYKAHGQDDGMAFYKDCSDSFRWLLLFLSDFISYPVVELYKYVLSVERKIRTRSKR